MDFELPSSDHLEQLCYALNVDALSFSNSLIACLKARFKKLNERQNLVSVLMDEMYSQQSGENMNGTFYGIESGKFMKTVMLKYVAG